MAKWSNVVITNKGKELISKMLSGVSVEFTSIKSSSYQFDPNVNFEEISVMPNVKQSVLISNISVVDGDTVSIYSNFNNKDLNIGYNIRNIGLYAKDPITNEEVLYSITSTDSPDYMPAFSDVTISSVDYNFVTSVGNSENVNINILDGNSVTIQEFNLFKEYVENRFDNLPPINIDSIEDIRITDGKFEYYNGTEWVRVRGDGYPVGNISNFTAKGDDTTVTLNWSDPLDVTIEDNLGNPITIARWKGTKILRKPKAQGYPQNENDGVLVVDNGVRDQYKTNGFVDTGLVNDQDYYYMAFPYTEEDIFTVDNANRIIGTPNEMQVYGVKVDTANSNPKTAVTYIEDSVGFTPMLGNNGNFSGGSWMDKFPFNEIKPCLLKDGVVNYYLNPNDYSKKLGGGIADITSGNDGDVMVEFPKIYWKFERVGTDLYVRYSDKKVGEGFKCLAHTVGRAEKDKIYISAYRGFSSGGKLRSLSGKTPTASQTIGQFRTLAQANGAGYQQMTYYSLLMLQVLYLIAFKDRDSQTALGRGFVDGNGAATQTGQTNTRGMFYGETTGKLQNKFCGIEDFWGNQYLFVDGMYSDGSRNMMISDQSVFNDNGSGYVNYGQGATSNLGGYIGGVQGGTESGFIIKASNGSATTHYSDSGALSAGRLPSLRGFWSDGYVAGAFGLYVHRTASDSGASYGARLCNLGS